MKLIGIITIIIIITFSVYSSVVLARSVKYSKEITEICIEENKIVNETSVFTYGPILPSLNIVEINFVNGVSSQIEKINRVLNNKFLHFIIPFKYIICTDLDFNITYTRNVSLFLPFIRRFSYFTTVYNESEFAFNNKTIYGESHTIVINGFNGFFFFTKSQPLRLNPANFGFVGNCKELAIIR
ncbi:MAG: hypothetical protein JSW06_07330 [Thermoplasmatales archaeon]|nr:MAG: hypothetical protein JSW06_07330 [Thermoplasmatales archaeon]